MIKLSVVLATRNEEKNIERCLASVKDFANEIIIVDEHSSDKTRQIAEKLGARVYLEVHHDNFHITKQIALDKAKGEWVLQLDADEVVSPELAKQILSTIHGSPLTVHNSLFLRHQKLIEARDGKIGKGTGDVVAYLIPRLNMFLGKPLTHAGTYPDASIRLVKNGKAHFPAKSVHEVMQIDGKVAWLSGNLLHYDSPTLKRYLWRNNRYTDLMAKEMTQQKLRKDILSFLLFTVYRPLFTFFNLYFRHLGILDGAPGFIWSFFSAARFPIAYFKYLTNKG